MNILQITPFFFPSKYGTELYTNRLIENLALLGHNVDVLTINTEHAKPVEVYTNNVRIVRCRQDFGYHRGLISFELMWKILKARSYDIYHCQAPAVFCLPVTTLAARINRIPLVITDHGHIAEGVRILEYLNNLSTYFYKSVNARFVDRIIFFTRSYAESLMLDEPVREKIRIIEPAIDTSKFYPGIDSSPLRRKYGLSDSNQVLLFVGALRTSYRQKGVDYLIRSMVEVKERFPNAKLFVVGGGGLVSEIRNIIHNAHLDDNVVMVGDVPYEEIHSYYTMCDIFVLPSYAEAYGFVLLEAMASGKPTISCDIPGAGELTRHGVTGLKVKPKDEKDLADKILMLLSNRELAQKMGANGRKIAESRSWEEVAKETVQIYEEVIREKRADK